MACGCIPSWDHSLCARSAALYLSAAAEVKCALCEAGLCPHTPHGTWMVFGWTQVLDQAISLLERIFNCKPKEPSNYSSSLKCIWRLYGVGLLGVFCSLLTGMNVKVFKFLKLKVYGCVSCGTSNMYLLLKMQKLTPDIPLVVLKYILVSTEESWDLLVNTTLLVSVRCFPFSRCMTVWEAASSWESGTSEMCLAGIRLGWTWAEGQLAFLF